jgi:hypothetical protein
MKPMSSESLNLLLSGADSNIIDQMCLLRRQGLSLRAAAIQNGASTVSGISKMVREELANTDTPVSRARAFVVAKGALIGGLNIKQTPMKAAMVALCYANSLSALAAANGLELSIAEQDQLLGLIGFADL